MSTISEGGRVTGPELLATFDYDSLGRRKKLTRGNGTSTAYDYDPLSRIDYQFLDLPGTASDLRLDFTHNQADQILTNTRSNSAYNHYPPALSSTTSTIDNLNRIDTNEGVKFSYDLNGNLTNDGQDTFSYSSENLLRSINGTATLWYDPLLRLRRSRYTNFAYDDVEMIAEYDNAGTLLRRHVFGPGIDEPLLTYEGSGTEDRRWLHADERGSIVAITDDLGAVLSVNRYDEYGVPDAGNTGRFQYTGQAWLPDVRLYHYKARMYNPWLGRFMQPDPIGYDDGPNMYPYVGADPVNGWDSTWLTTSGEIIVNGCSLTCQQARENQRQADIAALNSVVDWLGRIGQFALESAPGYGLVQCIGNGCSAAGWAAAGIELTPAGKLTGAGLRLMLRHPAGKALAARLQKALSGCGCFETGTLVATPEGLVPIETIKIGDLVLAQNEATGEIAAKPVTDLIRPEPKPLYRLALTDADGEAGEFHATDDHPWKVEGKGWVETVYLKAGDRIDTASGADMVVTSLDLTGRVERTYNLTVADWHTFMVGEDHAVVHNATCKLRPHLGATGPHTTYKKANGKITGYQSWTPNSKNPSGWDAGDRYRATGKPHGGVNPPLIIGRDGRARPANPNERP